ncbi:2-dehydro-3-deoxygalactonokinase [Martelella alba]|uniref:2-dehydro-3-deoxygalactonokinase n=1 Tax=Martelella alba TaxID=2590451 RepID=A0A506UGI0_9HYPH|nr:2-dehydro-3-deoxygalactonokinase [Martelella alba]TPW32465.1 2-dehydro-3-deoxygalactonokinase [Martelella alba]
MAGAFAAVEWGLTAFRAWLMEADGTVVSQRQASESLAAVKSEGFAEALESNLAALAVPRNVPVVICGMAGAKQGWQEVPPVTLPMRLDSLPSHAMRIDGLARDVRILPALAQRGADSDFMRGEETLLFGLFAGQPQVSARVCIPGRFSRWVGLEAGAVTRIATHMTGEMFSVLQRSSVLSPILRGAEMLDETAFLDAVERSFQAPALYLNAAHAIRARNLLEGIAPERAEAELFGLLVGTELAGGLSVFAGEGPVWLIASGQLCEFYEHAFQRLGQSCMVHDATAAAREGLAAAASQLFDLSGTADEKKGRISGG